jgi:hypothetical protein
MQSDCRPTRATVMASPPRLFEGWSLTIICGECGELQLVSAHSGPLAEALKSNATAI